MKKINTLRELQLANIAIYTDLVDFCNKNKITVYLHAGSLIGAIRHKGFIPWDDDIDVCMSRPDYEKLISVSEGKISARCSVIDPETCDDYNGYVPLIVYDDSKVVSGQYRTNETSKIAVSLFVYDGAPSNTLMRKIYYALMFLYRAEHALCRVDFKGASTTIAKKVGPLIQWMYSPKGIKKYKKKILKLQKKYPFSSSKYVSTNADYQASKEVCLKTDFEKSVDMVFEGVPSKTYSHYDEHLRKYYGDYMELPPIEKQRPKHSFDAWIADEFKY